MVLGDKGIDGGRESVGGHPGDGLDLGAYLLDQPRQPSPYPATRRAMIMEIPVNSMFCIQVGRPIRTMERTASSLRNPFPEDAT